MAEFTKSFWSSDIWLPPNVTWHDLDNRQGYAQFHHLLYPFPIALCLVALRTFLEIKVFRPFGRWLKIRDRSPPLPHPLLEAAWQTYSLSDAKGRLCHKQLAEDSGLTQQHVSRWFRRRAMASRPSPLDKFSETGWRWVFYLTIHLASVWVLWDKVWVWDTAHCWYNYPFHKIDDAVWWHYMVEMSFYWSLFVTQFFDVKRKDFWEMFIHHLATLTLLIFSYSNHMHRMGSVVLLVHDFADHWLELAKLLNYAQYKTSCDIVFAIFAFVFTFSRLGIFPTWIIYSTTVEAAQFVQMFPVYYIFNFLMTLLLILHMVWFYYTFLIAFKSIATGETKDSRSDSEEESDIEPRDDNNEY